MRCDLRVCASGLQCPVFISSMVTDVHNDAMRAAFKKLSEPEIRVGRRAQ